MNLFTKESRSTFPYWFAHWCAFNMTACLLGIWKVKYLFHDLEKPWLKLVLRDYKKVQKWHREHNRHHLEYQGVKKIDIDAMIIDNECSRFTKAACPYTAKEWFVDGHWKKGLSDEMISNLEGFVTYSVIPRIEDLGL